MKTYSYYADKYFAENPKEGKKMICMSKLLMYCASSIPNLAGI